MSTPLKFYLGEESHYIIEDYDTIKEKSSEKSIFADQYKKALQVIDAYIDAKGDKNSSMLQESRNNIIAFLGDRGTGKTSCMMSVLNMLGQHLKERGNNKEHTTTSVDMVDPSFFDENTNIIYLVVGKMFAAFKESVENKDEDSNEIHELMTAFQKVLSQISMMGKNPLNENDTDIHQLRNLLVTTDLKKSLKELVDCYLDFNKKDFLVIPVDDIDNNTDQAYQMMEQIRKYLILPNVIILISFKLEQISNVVELYFTKLYSPLNSKGHSTRSVNVSDMAQKYLLKLFPLEHRITLPDLKTMMDEELEVYKDKGEEAIISGSSMKYTMTSLIFRKTRYLFYHATGETSQIVPTNLREYRNLLSLLCNMNDYSENKDEYNKQQFRDYFYEVWTEKHLNEEGREIAKKLVEKTEAGQFNKLVLSLLYDYKSLADFKKTDSQKSTPDEYDRILNKGNQAYNISIGDVFSLLSEWKKYLESEEDKALLFFIESLYSIKLYHYYDEVTEPKDTEKSKNDAIDQTIKRLNGLENVSNYAKLIGGAFFNPTLFPFLPADNKNQLSRSYRVVNIRYLKIVIAHCIKKGEDVTDLEFQVVEFFALALSRRLIDKTGGSLSPTYRTGSEVYYRTELDNSRKAIFDLGSFFASITDIKYAYERLHKGLYELASKRPNSLLNKLIEQTKKQYNLGDNYDNNRFLSWCSFRNAVILQEFGNSFDYVKTDRTRTAVHTELLQKFFKQVANFQIKTYDKTDKDEAYDIKFDYAKVYVDFFDNLMKEEGKAAFELFNLVFDNIDFDVNSGSDASPRTSPQAIVENSDSNVPPLRMPIQPSRPVQDGNRGFDEKEITSRLNVVNKSKLKKRILDKSSITADNVDFWTAFNEKLPEDEITKEKAKQALIELKKEFNL